MRAPEPRQQCIKSDQMKIKFYGCHFLPRAISRFECEVPADGNLLRDSPSSVHILLIGVRSPGDQLHVVAIKPCDADELGRWIAADAAR
jgi:hypothetical protein